MENSTIEYYEVEERVCEDCGRVFKYSDQNRCRTTMADGGYQCNGFVETVKVKKTKPDK